jgi:hypothetical protein
MRAVEALEVRRSLVETYQLTLHQMLETTESLEVFGSKI